MSPSKDYLEQRATAPEIIAGGSTALIKLFNDTHVEKVPYPESRDYDYSIRDLKREYAVYKRLPEHPRLLRLHDTSGPERIVLPYLKNGCLNSYLRATPVSSIQRLHFAADAAEGLLVLHSAGIVHGDINSWNFLVGNDFRLYIIDFAGSTIDGQPGSAFEGAHYCLPRSIDDPSTVCTDLFALGSLLYEISTSEQPYAGVDDQEIEKSFQELQFPRTQGLLLGDVILGCWQGIYGSAERVYEDILDPRTYTGGGVNT